MSSIRCSSTKDSPLKQCEVNRGADTKTGDRVRVIAVPPNLPDDEQLQTRALFEKCVGQVFTVVAVHTLPELQHDLIQLDVGAVSEQPATLETIWIEPEFLAPAE